MLYIVFDPYLLKSRLEVHCILFVHHLLLNPNQVTKDRAQLEDLKENDPGKAKKLAEKAAWRKAMDQSKGVKVSMKYVLCYCQIVYNRTYLRFL